MKENYFLAKWLANEITDVELKKHISNDEFITYKKIKAASKNLSAPKFNAEKALRKINENKHKQKVRKLQFNYFYKIAAVIAILVSSFYFISSKNKVYVTKYAEKTSFELPDNSKVDLNADSKITFKEKNWNTHRNLKLKGEAFFSVEKGSKFTVNTKLGSVSVLGTKFNVIARDNYFQVTCYRGLVSVKYKNKTIKVPAGTSFKTAKNNNVKISKINDNLPSWIQNFSSFKSMPYYYVIDELQRQYKIVIKYDKKYANTLFTGNFTHTNLNAALKSVTIPLNLTFKTIGENKISFIENEN
jgi:ferric-dicitrate binding protein FerR (iron transport regulator)